IHLSGSGVHPPRVTWRLSALSDSLELDLSYAGAPAAHRRIKVLLENLLTFNSVCKKLQEDDLSMAAVRVLFDRIIEMYPVTKEHLSPDARIVHSPSFESGVVKVATNRVEALSEDETTALKSFELQVEQYWDASTLMALVIDEEQ
ncbi:hypothetical protein PHMEG_00031944, partial [Phytophthora megakarya]